MDIFRQYFLHVLTLRYFTNMDRRSIFFILTLTVAMFGVNAFFSWLDQDRNKEWYAEQQAIREKKREQLISDIETRTAPANLLPLAKVYSNKDKTEYLSTGAITGNLILVSSQDLELPQIIYTDKGEFKQVLDDSKYSNLIVYSQGTPDSPAVPLLNDLGNYELQLVFPSHDAEAPFTQTISDYRDGQMILPLNQLGKDFADEFHVKLPRVNGFAFYKRNNTFYPVGLYLPEYRTLVPFDKVESLSNFIKVEAPIIATTTKPGEKPEEKFYVLENGTQQIVFSNYGGAIAELNLPFQSKENPQSVVKEIEYDRLMVKQHPENALFPSHGYYTAGTEPQFHSKGKLGGYYPLIRRDLIEKPPFKTVRVKPVHYALNIVSEYPEVADLVYEVKEFTDKKIVFEATQPHRRITKTYEFAGSDEEAPYSFNLTVKVEGDSRGLWLSSGVPEVEWISGGVAPALKYRITVNKKPKVEGLSLPTDPVTVATGHPDWLCNSNGFLGVILDPLTEVDPGYKAVQVSGIVVPSRLVEIDQDYQLFKAADMPGYSMMLPLKTSGGTMSFRVVAGPFSENVLKTLDKTFSDPAIGYNPDYIACQTNHGIFTFISEPFSKFLLIIMKFFYNLTHSWGFSIILLTVVLRIILYPLNTWSMKSMIKMQQVAPEVTAMQEKYKKDPKKLQLEIANLYRERGVNPFSGCLPLLIQLPFLVGMFDLLKSTFELRGASFIPGWIDDLAAPDVLFRWDYPIFFIGTEFHLLPLLFAAVMFVQQRMSSTVPSDPKLMTDQQRQQRTMGNMMTILFAVMFYHVPSGLNIYWISSLLLGILQQWWTSRNMGGVKAPVIP